MSLTTQLFPPLDGATEAALRASIERFGVIVPVVEDQHGNTLDGYQRRRIADELGLPYEIQTVDVASDAHARAITCTLNTDRRHLTLEQRRELVAALRADGHSERAIAGALQVPKTTVHRDIEHLVQVDQLRQPAQVTGIDGKSRKSERKAAAVASATARLERELERIDESYGIEVERVGAEEALAEEMRRSVRVHPLPVREADLPEGICMAHLQPLLAPLRYQGRLDAMREVVALLEVTTPLTERERAYLLAKIEYLVELFTHDLAEARRILASHS